MPAQTYLQTILSAFEQLDIEKLRFYLKDEYSYQDTTKEIFLEKLEEKFNAFKKEGDTAFLLYKGKCAGESCENCGKGGYRFVGNNSKNYLTFLFVEEGEDDIKDIFDCGTFKTNEDTGELNGSTDIYIHRDEEISFNKTPEYWSKVEAAQNAYNEIYTTPIQPITFEDIEYWLSKHAYTNEKIGAEDIFSPTMRWTPFTNLYREFSELIEYINEHKQELQKASLAYSKVANEKQLLEWLLEYESLYENAPFDYKYAISRSGDNYTNGRINPLLFNGDTFNSVMAFSDNYNSKHSEMLEKYSTYSDQDVSDIFGDEQYRNNTDHVFSLRFHLDKRKEADELGMVIPFYLNPPQKKPE